MQSNKEELKKTLLDLLLEDKEFRHAVAGAIGYKELLDRFARVEERMAKNQANSNRRFVRIEKEIRDLREEMNKLRQDMLEGFRRHDAEFARVWESIEKLRQDMQEGFRRHDEELKRHWESIEKLRQDMLEGFRRHDEEFARVWESIEKLRQDMLEGFRRHDEEFAKMRQDMQEGFKRHDKLLQELWVGQGSLGRRMGKDLEKLILNIYRDQLMQLGIDKDKARRFKYIDKEGLYGLKGKVYEFDVVVSNSHVDILEVKSYMEEEDMVVFYEKVNSIRQVIEVEYRAGVKRLIAVAVHIDKEAVDKARELGIECIYGNMVTD
ncbi:MAG: hypothetical protein QW560_01060 [Candidatus Nitrosocaldus sp.]